MERLGVKFKLKKDGLEFSGKGIKPKPRKPREMKDVVFDPDSLESWKEPLYLMYRNLEKLASPEIKRVFKENKVHYDLTLIKPGFIGPEYNRTHGHFHPRSGRGRYYCEIYEVLSGEGLILLQHRKLEDFIVVEVEKGQAVFIPGEYGHIAVNTGKKPLLLGNLVIDGFKADYETVKKKRGFAYYVFKNEIFVPNLKYRKHPTLVLIYGDKSDRLDKEFLAYPELFRDLLLGKAVTI